MGRADVPNCPEAGEGGHRAGARGRVVMARIAARSGLVTIAALSLLALTATGASALVRHLANGKTVSYQPVQSALAQPLLAAPAGKKGIPLLYHGGPVMSSNTNYTFYWAPAGSPAYAVGYQEGINLYFERLPHDSGGHQNVDSVSAQLNDSAD